MNRTELKTILDTLVKANPEVKDLFEDYHAMPTKDELKTGPAERSSGDGVKMITQYSDVAPQVALAEEYRKFQDMLADFGSMMKSEFGALRNGITAILSAQVMKGRNAASIEKSIEDGCITLGRLQATGASPEKVAKARQKITALRDELSFVKALESGNMTSLIEASTKVKAEDEKEEKEESHEEEKAISFKKGQDAAWAEFEKMLGEMEGKEEKEEDKAEGEMEGKKEEKEEEKAAPHTDGNTAATEAKKAKVKSRLAKIKKANDEHDAGGKFSEKLGESDEKEEKAKAEIRSLKTKVDEVVKSLENTSKNAGGAPAIKAGEVVTVRSKVLDAIAKGELGDGASLEARSLLQQYEAVENGKLGKDVFDRNLGLSSSSVRDVFKIN